MNANLETQTLSREAWRSMSDLSDDRLVELVRSHNPAAFEALMRRHNRRLFRVTRSVLRDVELAEDAVQEAYLRAFTRLETYEPAGRFGAWLSRIALNEALMIKRRSRNDTVSIETIAEESLVAEETAERPGGERFVEAAHARALLESAIDGLPEHFRMVFVLRVVEGLDVRETAESLELHLTTVRTRLFRAQKHLRAELTRQLREQSTELYDFGAERCDHVVRSVLERLARGVA